MSDANRYRREAEECQRNAENAILVIDREAWLRLATHWAKLAEDAELSGLGDRSLNVDCGAK